MEATFADTVERAVAAHHLVPLARVQENQRTTDFAFPIATLGICVLRVVRRATDLDYSDLRTMLIEGDCEHAILVYGEADKPDLSEEIESCWIGGIEALAASLARGDASS